ncbi:hypothetical protein QTP88_021511 [Uroleucon formosanum]
MYMRSTVSQICTLLSSLAIATPRLLLLAALGRWYTRSHRRRCSKPRGVQQPPAVHKILSNYYYGSFDAAAGVNIVQAEGSRTGAADKMQAVHVPEHLPLCPLPPGV